MTLLILIFAGYFGGFRWILWSSRFLGLGFWLFGSKIPHWQAFSKRFCGCKTTALGTVMICLISVKMESESGFSFDVHCFFNKVIETIKLVAALLYFSSQQKFWAFSEKPNDCAFFKAPSESNSINIDCRCSDESTSFVLICIGTYNCTLISSRYCWQIL